MALRNLLGSPPFDRLTVVERGPNSAASKARWWCVCTCGARILVCTSDLVSRNTRSCGCLRDELARQRFQTHGLRETPEYKTWKNMKNRCLNPKNQYYYLYGGRDIAIDARWIHSFQTFYADMGPRPGPEYTLERVKNHLGYSPENCVWATPAIQSRNTRNNRMITLDGRTECLADWFHLKHVSDTTFYRRLKQGMSEEEALNRPVRPRRKNRHLNSPCSSRSPTETKRHV